ncbi:hypothetical protein SAMN02745687_01849, partial [Lachnospiraceae bacterium NK3A20]
MKKRNHIELDRKTKVTQRKRKKTWINILSTYVRSIHLRSVHGTSEQTAGAHGRLYHFFHTSVAGRILKGGAAMGAAVGGASLAQDLTVHAAETQDYDVEMKVEAEQVLASTNVVSLEDDISEEAASVDTEAAAPVETVTEVQTTAESTTQETAVPETEAAVSEVEPAMTVAEPDVSTAESATTATKSDISMTESVITATESDVSTLESALPELGATSETTDSASELTAEENVDSAAQAESETAMESDTETQSTENAASESEAESALPVAEESATDSESVAPESDSVASESATAGSDNEFAVSESAVAESDTIVPASESQIAESDSTATASESQIVESDSIAAASTSAMTESESEAYAAAESESIVPESSSISEISSQNIEAQPRTLRRVRRSLSETASHTEQQEHILTNEQDYSNMTVHSIDAEGKVTTADAERAEQVKNFLDEVGDVSDVSVYADEYRSNGHSDGHVIVNVLQNTTTIQTKEQYGSQQINTDYATQGYSYIGSTAPGVQVQTSSNYTSGNERATIAVGSNVNVAEESGTANHFDKVVINNEGDKLTEQTKEAISAHKEMADFADDINIEKNLAELSEAGKAITDHSAGTTNGNGDIEAIGALIRELRNGNFGSSDIVELNISLNTLTSDAFNNTFNNGIHDRGGSLIGQLVNSNTRQTNIVLNVTTDGTSADGTHYINKNFANSIRDYDPRGAYLVWNFGDFAGDLVFNGQAVGVIIAPDAKITLNNGIQTGSIAAEEVITNGEIHMGVKGTYGERETHSETDSASMSESISLSNSTSASDSTSLSDSESASSSLSDSASRSESTVVSDSISTSESVSTSNSLSESTSKSES